MQTKFSEDAVSLSELKTNLDKVVDRGMPDIREGDTVSLEEARKILGLA